MSFAVFEKRNNAVAVNPPTLLGRVADIHITEHGSSWLWAAFTLFAIATIVFLGLGYTKPQTDRIFHYLTAGITMVATIAYFSLASDLGFAPIPVEFQRGSHHVSGRVRQVFYVRYIDWFITTPLLLLDLLLTSGLPWQRILFTVLVDWVMIITGLVGALTTTRYKWGYFTFGCVALVYIIYTLLIPARRHAAALGSDVSRAYNIVGIWTLVLWVLYPIAWAVSEGGNVISPDSESVFYGVLDVLAKIGFGAALLWGHKNIDPARLGLKFRSYDEDFGRGYGSGTEKRGIGQGSAVGNNAGTAGTGTTAAHGAQGNTSNAPAVTA